MNRSQRLLSLLQILRSYRTPVTAQSLSERMGVSLRTLYRDIASLKTQGADIMGEPGLGYVLRPGFFLPPLMFSQNELEALHLGMLWVSQFGDSSLSQSSDSALIKIKDVLPKSMRQALDIPLRVGPPAAEVLQSEDLSFLRKVIQAELKLEVVYDKELYKIRLWPFALGYFTTGRILVGWNETKAEYCMLSTQKIRSCHSLQEHYPKSRQLLFKEWQALQLFKIKSSS